MTKIYGRSPKCVFDRRLYEKICNDIVCFTDRPVCNERLYTGLRRAVSLAGRLSGAAGVGTLSVFAQQTATAESTRAEIFLDDDLAQ